MKRGMNVIVSATMLSLAGCGAADDAVVDSEHGEETAAAVQAEVDAISQRLGEPACGSIAADATLVPNPGEYNAGSAESPDGNYDHPECRNGFIVDIEGQLAAGRDLSVTTGITSGEDWLRCLFSYAYASLWEQRGGRYSLVREVIGWGQLSVGRPGLVCTRIARVPPPRPGQYRVVAAAGQLFGPTERVSVRLAQLSE